GYYSPIKRCRGCRKTPQATRGKWRWIAALAPTPNHARELFAPPGSNRSGDEGNEGVGASGVEGRVGDSASMQAVTRVNAEQASKRLMQEPTHRVIGEGRC